MVVEQHLGGCFSKAGENHEGWNSNIGGEDGLEVMCSGNI